MPKKKDALAEFLGAWKESGFKGPGSDPHLEYRFHPTRRWRFDIAWPDLKLAVEIDGFGFGHQSIKGVVSDKEKQNAATVMGWRVLRYITQEMTRAPRLKEVIEQVMDAMQLCLLQLENTQSPGK